MSAHESSALKQTCKEMEKYLPQPVGANQSQVILEFTRKGGNRTVKWKGRFVELVVSIQCTFIKANHSKLAGWSRLPVVEHCVQMLDK